MKHWILGFLLAAGSPYAADNAVERGLQQAGKSVEKGIKRAGRAVDRGAKAVQKGAARVHKKVDEKVRPKR
jgi:hypothetical protein